MKYLLAAVVVLALVVAAYGIGGYWLSISTFAFIPTVVTAALHIALLGGLAYSLVAIIRSKA